MFIYIYRLIFRNKKPKTNYNININNCDNVIDSININGNNSQLPNYIYIDGELHRFPTKINVDGTTYKVINNKKGIKNE